MARLEPHWAYLQAELQAADAAPLSARRAMLVAVLVDAYVDRLFEADPQADDILEFRAMMAARSAALAMVMALCRLTDGWRLEVQTVAIPVADYGTLAVEDFMVSLYNNHSVQRLRLVSPAKSGEDIGAVLKAAIVALDR